MSDLISRSELIKEIDKLLKSPYANQEQSRIVIKDTIEIVRDLCVKKQPTAYSVNDVVKELELHSFEFGTDSIPAHYVRLNDAIEIVKRGGINDN